MAAKSDIDMRDSMVISGSVVTVVGIIFFVTITMAFIMMIAFGVAVVLAGLFLYRKSKDRHGNESEGPRQG